MTIGVLDRFAAARAVADAVLYEGYVLYPYRASSRKNQIRWQFGVLTPRSFSEAEGSERWSMRTECLVDPGPAAVLAVRVRCLQVQHRSVEAPVPDSAGLPTTQAFARVDTLSLDGKVYVDWDEAVDQVVDLPPLRLSPLGGAEHEEVFRFSGGSETELIQSGDGIVAGRIIRQRQALEGRIRINATRPDGPGQLVKVTVSVENATAWEHSSVRREEVMGHSLIAVHTMLAVENGVFVSLLDPPEYARQAVADCHSDGAFPVLVGGEDVMLSSPIILYDYPEVAPESPGDLYDSTEIDEILALRVLTLTDEEKSEARGTDPRAAAIIDRCDGMAPEMWERLHGAVRALRPAGEPEAALEVQAGEEPQPLQWWDPTVDASVDPWTDTVVIAGVQVAKGTAVRLAPSHRSDAQDLFLRGLTARVAGVFNDVDGSVQVAVSIEDDPATEELAWQGRYLFFHPDEVEPLPDQDGIQ